MRMRAMTAAPLFAVLAVGWLAAGTSGQTLASPATPQTPQSPAQLPPIFRGEVDLIRLDVSVLDGDRRPVTGLTADDFTLIEDGTPQRIAAFTEVLMADRDPKPTAWMRHAGVDVSTNDLLDQLGEGRPYAIVMDDWNIESGDLSLVNKAREAGREIVDRLGPSDVAAVIFVYQTGRTVDFTSDRVKLSDAVNGFEGRHRDALDDLYLQQAKERQGPQNPRTPRPPPAPWAPGGFGGATSGADIVMRSSRILGRSDCERDAPLVPALEVAARRLAMIPDRRKSIVLVSVGMPLGRGPGCAGVLNIQMNQTYSVAEQANINIYAVDVSDDRRIMNTMLAPQLMFLKDVADYTGGLVVGTDDEPIEMSVERVFAEAGSYYLIGYQSSQGKPDGKFRRVEVRVNRSYVKVRHRSGYFAPTSAGERAQPEMDRAGQTLASLWDTLITPPEQLAARPPTANSLALSGLYPPAGLPLRVSVVPLGPGQTPATRDIKVAVVLSVRLPPARAPLDETVTLVRHLYDAKGKAGPAVITRHSLTVPPATGNESRYDLYQNLILPPGRYEVRLSATSAAIDRHGTVFAKFDVPDVARLPIALSGIALGGPISPRVERGDALAELLPIVPTSARHFIGSDEIAAFFRLFQATASPRMPVALRVLILDRHDQAVLDTTEIIEAEAFADPTGVERQMAVPLSEMSTGPYLLSITATRPDRTTARRDVVFRYR